MRHVSKKSTREISRSWSSFKLEIQSRIEIGLEITALIFHEKYCIIRESRCMQTSQMKMSN